MLNHIEEGYYILRQKSVKVGELTVCGTGSTVEEHWFLFKSGGSAYAKYTPPSLKTNQVVELEFEFSPTCVDPKDIKDRLETQGIAAYDIISTFVDALSAPIGDGGRPPSRGPIRVHPTPIPLPSPEGGRGLHPRGDGPDPTGQIDWGTYKISQGGHLVGFVDVAKNASGLPQEAWILFTAGGGLGTAAYLPPGRGGTEGAIFHYALEPHPYEGLPSLSGYTYETLFLDCSRLPIISP
jgi:hypothetical protein